MRKIKSKIISFDEYPECDTIWSMCCFNKHIYIGLCIEFKGGGSAKLIDYNIEKDSVKLLADMEEVTGEANDSGFATQGKIHFTLCPCSFDNKIYGATHCTTPPLGDSFWTPFGMWNDKHKKFPGAHFFEYDIPSGETYDWGIVTPNEGIPYLVFDESRRMFYGVTYPRAHFISFDTKSKNFRDYGKVSQMYPLNMILIPGKVVYFSDHYGIIKKYSYSAEDIVDTGIHLPKQQWSDGRKNWLYSSVYDGGKYIYGLPYTNPQIVRINVNIVPEKLEILGNGLPDGISTGVMRGIALSRGKIYYTTHTNSAVYLMEYDIKKSSFYSHGRFNPGKKDAFCWIGDSDDSGNIYFAECSRRPLRLFILKPE